MKRRLRSTFPLIIAVLFIPLLVLVGFLINHITMFVDYFTVKNTVITVLVLYAIISNWVIVHLQFDKREIDHRNEIEGIEYEESLGIQERENNDLHIKINDLKGEARKLRGELADLKGKINQNK